MTEAERVYSARQAAERLGLSAAMTRRYASALEEVTGQPVKQHPRDGRQYRDDQLAAMIQAKAFVEANPRLSVADALRAALGLTPEAVAPEALQAPETGSQALEAAFARALERSLLPELRELRAEVAMLRSEARERSVIEAPALPGNPDTFSTANSPGDLPAPAHDDGLLVRLARRLEQGFRRIAK